ncbi:MAG: DNA repair protein RadA [Nakamurella sp.]
MSNSGLSRRTSRSYRCTGCGHLAAKWTGQCPECDGWGTLEEQAAAPVALRRVVAQAVVTPAVRLKDVDPSMVAACPTGIPEFDRVLGGGLIPGGVVLLAGEPGIGKSTLLLVAAQSWAAHGNGRALIVTGEETAAQVRLRAGRLGAVHEDLFIAAETELGAILAHIDEVAPQLLIIDSIQTIADAATDGATGGVSQVRAVAAALTAASKARSIACVMVGHVTKDGAIAGPRVVEHLVDVVLHFEGERGSLIRTVRGVKNRFGPADEVGCFQMTESGIESVSDPSGLFVSDRRPGVPGICTTVMMQGRRALPVEIQTLVGPGGGGAHRTVSGLDQARVSMVLAVAAHWAGLSVAGSDVLAATVGGARTTEPAADLALALAVWSSMGDIPLPTSLVVLGELGLSGDVRPIPAVAQRLTEAARFGFDTAIVPVGDYGVPPAGMQVSQVSDLLSALRALGDGVQAVSLAEERRA